MIPVVERSTIWGGTTNCSLYGVSEGFEPRRVLNGNIETEVFI